MPETALFYVLLIEMMGKMGRLLGVRQLSVLTMVPCVVQLKQVLQSAIQTSK